jgi:rRNA maturation RNase YbeY
VKASKPKKRNPAPRKWSITVDRKVAFPELDPRKVKRTMQRILEQLTRYMPEEVCELGVSFIGDKEMRELNRSYRGKDKTTDVLSFANLEGPALQGAETFLGDLVISVPVLRKQARDYGVTRVEELLRLLVHGTLHLCGFDHEGVSQTQAQRMRRMEQKLLDVLLKRRK